MKKYIPYIIIAGLLLYIFLFQGCGDSGTTTVTTPEVKGSFPAVTNPTPQVPPQKVYVYKYIDRITRDTVTLRVENPLKTELLEKFEESKNKDSLYADAIGELEYNLPLEDSLLLTNNYIKAQGKVLQFKQSYVIKPQKVPVRSKETAFRMLAGLEVGNTLQVDNIGAKASLMLQNRKGNILSVGYDVDRRIWVGYHFSIFSIKK